MMERSRPLEDQRTPCRLNRTIVLVGLMGAGKTSVGKRVAARLGVRFFDSDAEIELAAGMTIPEIFVKFGEAAFRDGERRVIARLLLQAPHVLATGGGAFIEPATRAEIAGRALSVWLRADVEVLWQRIRGKPGRPLLQTANPRARLVELSLARSDYYARADVTVDSARDVSHDAMAEQIIAAVRAHDAGHPERTPTLERCEP
jgi:shikimate kinase